MRAIISKVVAVSMIAGAGLMVTACGGETTATVNNTTTVETVTSENGAEDTMTGVDAATGNGTVVETNTTTTTTENTTTNAM
jgi:hypothetical protein